SFFIFFFSSRRRHTRFSRDWSSDVCSSDLTKRGTFNQPVTTFINSNISVGVKPDLYKIPQVSSSSFVDYEKFLYEQGYYNGSIRSEERRVGKERRVLLSGERVTATVGVRA